MAENKSMQGRRIYPDETGAMNMDPGDYGKWHGGWLLCLPSGIRGQIKEPLWKITEHEDGTITASPSIMTTSPGNPELDWHGFLEKGFWRGC